MKNATTEKMRFCGPQLAIASPSVKGKFTALGYKDFEDYCAKKWQMTKVHAHRLIKATCLAETLESNQMVTPASEAQVRPLAKLQDADDQREAWKIANKASEGKPTEPALKLRRDDNPVIDPARSCMTAIARAWANRWQRVFTDRMRSWEWSGFSRWWLQPFAGRQANWHPEKGSTMNNVQRVLLAGAALVILWLCLCPPRIPTESREAERVTHDEGHQCLWNSSREKHPIDYFRLGFEVIGIALAGGILFLSVKDEWDT